MKKRRNIAIVLAIFLAVVLTIGGSLAYYTYTSNEVQNVVEDNYNWVSITESEGYPVTDSSGNITNSVYEIVPGTSQENDPTVTASYSLDSYVFLEVTDTSGGLITWATVSDWTLLTAEYDSDGNITHAVYYQLLDTTGTPTGDTPIEYWIQTLPVLEGNQISYSSSISNNSNSVTVDGSGVPTTADKYSLTFQSYIIQADISGSSLTNPSAESAMECWYALAGQEGLGVAAINGVLYPDVTEAILAVEEQGTVTLLTNTATTTSVGATDEVPQEYTIDLNGFTLTLNNSMQLSAVENTYVTEANFYSIFGEAYSSKYSYLLGYLVGYENIATDLTIKNGTVEIASSSGYVLLEGGTTLTLEDVTFTNTTSSTTAQKAIQYNISDSKTTNTLTVTDCTFDNTYVSVTGSSGGSYELIATFTDCDFTATVGNSGSCVSFNHYIYGTFTFTDCNFEVTGSGNMPSAIYLQETSSNVSGNSIELILNDVTIDVTSSTYATTGVPVYIRDTSVVNVTDNKASVYSYMLDGSPVTYDGTPITVVTATADASSFTSALQSSSQDTTGNTVVALNASTAYTVTSSDIQYLSNATIVGAEDGTSTLDVSVLSMTTSVTDLTVSNVTFVTSDGENYAFQFSGSGTFTNCVFSSENASSGSSGIRYVIANGDLVFEDCTIYGKVYGINIGEGTGNVTLKNCDITGWNSFGNTGTVTIEGCTFHYSGSYGTLRFYQDATVTDCTFDSDFEWIDVSKDGVTITITDCVWTNKTLTDMLYFNTGTTNATWIVDGVEVTVTLTH